VPVAAVELRGGAGAVGAEELRAHAATRLARYELPAEIRIVGALPRTTSGKPDLAAVRALFVQAGVGVQAQRAASGTRAES
jgi:acyl-CoA synthetase (AMP-forming)/AMP-acid ligase II